MNNKKEYKDNLFCIKCKNELKLVKGQDNEINTMVVVDDDTYFHNEFSCVIHSKDANFQSLVILV